MTSACRNLILVLGDQLDQQSPALRDADPKRDRVLMIEARSESQRIPSHPARTTLFLAAMRHFAEWLRREGFELVYIGIDQAEAESFESGLEHAIETHRPGRLRAVEAGEHGVARRIEAVCKNLQLPLDWLPDSHFLCSREEFLTWRRSKSALLMENFYRWMRRRHDILMQDGKPEGGRWNFDRDNRKGFGRQGPGLLPAPLAHPPDRITSQIQRLIGEHFPDNPGSSEAFSWPVTREQALASLADFVTHRLADFGRFQDAMWEGSPWLYHSALSTALNLKLLHPSEVITAVLDAHREGLAPLNSVEGFVRQVIGWREYVRGIYWSEGEQYLTRNALQAEQPLPGFYWSADTDMACLRDVVSQVLTYGYAHHIQRLMVTGLFALLLGVRPQELHEWFLATHVDAVEWVEAPNTLGMSQYADGGLLASKPYAASGRYIQRMSNHCSGCRYDPAKSTGADACPFTTLYWDFLMRHRERFAAHPRAAMQWRMLEKLAPTQRAAIRRQAGQLKERLAGSPGPW